MVIITFNFQLSTLNFQLSTFNFQLSTFNYQLSTINYQLSQYLPSKSARKMKKQSVARFFGTYERATVTYWRTPRCWVTTKSVQFLLAANDAKR